MERRDREYRDVHNNSDLREREAHRRTREAANDTTQILTWLVPLLLLGLLGYYLYTRYAAPRVTTTTTEQVATAPVAPALTPAPATPAATEVAA